MKYTVKSGDTLSEIATRNGLKDWSGITGYKSGNPNLILPGEELSLPDPVTSDLPQTGGMTPSAPTLPAMSMPVNQPSPIPNPVPSPISSLPTTPLQARVDQETNPTSDYKTSITQALAKEGITDPKAIAYALATTQHETAGTNKPINEYGGSQYFTKMYEGRRDLGNNQSGDGDKYHGRGYIQLTGRSNYRDMGKRIGVDLENNPDLALEPNVAAKILAAFMKDRGVADLASKGDFIGARRPVNGSDQAQKIASLAQQYLSNM